MKVRGTVEGVQVFVAATREGARQAPYAAATMLTRLAGDVRGRLQRRLPEVFDRPVDFTIRGVFMRGASRDKLEAEVFFPDSQDERGRQRREYMRPGARGATRRNQKKTEFLLTRIGVLPPGWVTAPGKGAKLDAHGNIPGSVYRQIINVLQIRYNRPKPVSGRSQKAAQRLGVDALFFAVAPGPNQLAKGGGWLPPGVWRHLPGRRITQILKFVKKASYRQRLRVVDEAKQVVGAQAARRWSEASASIRARFSQGRRR